MSFTCFAFCRSEKVWPSDGGCSDSNSGRRMPESIWSRNKYFVSGIVLDEIQKWDVTEPCFCTCAWREKCVEFWHKGRMKVRSLQSLRKVSVVHREDNIVAIYLNVRQTSSFEQSMTLVLHDKICIVQNEIERGMPMKMRREKFNAFLRKSSSFIYL